MVGTVSMLEGSWLFPIVVSYIVLYFSIIRPFLASTEAKNAKMSKKNMPEQQAHSSAAVAARTMVHAVVSICSRANLPWL